MDPLKSLDFSSFIIFSDDYSPSSSAFVSFLSYSWLFNVATSFVNGPYLHTINSPPAPCVQGDWLVVVLHDDGLTTLGTLLSPKKPRVKQREQKPRSRRQQMEYRWLERWNEFTS